VIFATTVSVDVGGVYVFLTTTDDETRVFVDGREAFSVLCASSQTVCDPSFKAVDLSAGLHAIQVRNINRGFKARLFMTWQHWENSSITVGGSYVTGTTRTGRPNYYQFGATEGITYMVKVQSAEPTNMNVYILQDEGKIIAAANHMLRNRGLVQIVWTCSKTAAYTLMVMGSSAAATEPEEYILGISTSPDPCSRDGVFIQAEDGAINFSPPETVAANSCSWKLTCSEGLSVSIAFNAKSNGLHSPSISVFDGLTEEAGRLSGPDLYTSTGGSATIFLRRTTVAFSCAFQCKTHSYLPVQANGVQQQGYIGVSGEQDYYQFAGKAGKTYTIEQRSITVSRVVLRLIHLDAETQLAMVDDQGAGAATIDWTCTLPGDYIVMVSAFAEAQSGRYALNISETQDVCSGKTQILDRPAGSVQFSTKTLRKGASECRWNLQCQDGEVVYMFFTGFDTTHGVLSVTDSANQELARLSGALGADSAGHYESQSNTIGLSFDSNAVVTERFGFVYSCQARVYQIRDCVVGQLLTQYYSNVNLVGDPIVSVCNGWNIEQHWSFEGESLLGGQTDNFSIRWSGTLAFTGGNYVFLSRSDDGSRVYVDGSLILDHWKDCCAVWYSGGVGLVSGQHAIAYEYSQLNDEAYCTLSWTESTSPNSRPCTTGTCLNGGSCTDVDVPKTKYSAAFTAYTLQLARNFSELLLDPVGNTRTLLDSYLVPSYAEMIGVPPADVMVLNVEEYTGDTAMLDPQSRRDRDGVFVTINFAILCTPLCPDGLTASRSMSIPSHTEPKCTCIPGFGGDTCQLRTCRGLTYFLEMRSSAANGWDGNVFTIEEPDGTTVVTDVTLSGGDIATTHLCLNEGTATCFLVHVGGGAAANEVMWTLYDGSHTRVLTGGAPFDGSLNC
jgi:hypothetical protein